MNTSIIVSTYPKDPFYTKIKEILDDLGYKNVIYKTPDKKQTFSKNNNDGAKEATTKYILFLNSDTIPTAGFVEEMEKILDKTSGVGVVGCKLLYAEDFQKRIKFKGKYVVITGKKGHIQHAGIQYNNALLPYESGTNAHKDVPEVNTPKLVGSVTGACMLVRRDEFLELGGFDENFINGWEDTDLCLRYLEKLNKISYYTPKAEVEHFYASSLNRFDSEDKNYRYWFNKWHESERIFKLFQKPIVKLDLGCGFNKKEGYFGIDKFPGKDIDIIYDLEQLKVAGAKLPFEDNHFDEVYCANVLQQVSCFVEVMNEIHRILRHNGLLTLIVPHARSWIAHENPFNQRYFIPEMFKSYFASNKLEDAQFQEVNVNQIKPWHIEEVEMSNKQNKDDFYFANEIKVLMRTLK